MGASSLLTMIHDFPVPFLNGTSLELMWILCFLIQIKNVAVFFSALLFFFVGVGSSGLPIKRLKV